MSQTRRWLLLLTAISVIIVGGWTAYLQVTKERDDECIPTDYPLAYPYQRERTVHTTEEFQVPESWVPQLQDPDSRIGRPRNIIKKNDEELWLLESGILKVDLITGMIDEVPLLFDGQTNHYIKTLYLTSSRRLIAIGIMQGANNTRSMFVAEYSETEESFHLLSTRGAQGLLLGGSADVVEDHNGDIWVALGESLWYLDPQSWKLTELLGPSQGYYVYDLVQDKQRWFWMVVSLTPQEVEVRGPGFRVNEWFLLSMNPDSGEIEEGSSPPGTHKFRTGAQPKFSLFVDDSDRIWANDYGWLQMEDSGVRLWYQIVRSPIFITTQRVNPFEHFWTIPDPVLQTDGRLIWFVSPAGIARLDLDTESWCLLNRIVARALILDSDNQLWVASEGQIYVYRLDGD